MRLAVIPSVLLTATLAAQAQTAPTLPPAPTPVLVELFTSEGCSSCPPADALLKKISNYRTTSNQLIIALSEHVTYWNQLGWVDPFSDQTWTARQTRYGQRFHLDDVYTPQVVVNGTIQTLGSDGAAILKAVQQQTDSPIQIHIDTATLNPDKTVALTYTLTGTPTPGTDLYAVIADDMVTSTVLRGENSGRTLTHVAVARTFTKLPSTKSPTTSISLPSTTTIKGQPTAARHVVLFAQSPNLGRILAIDTKPL